MSFLATSAQKWFCRLPAQGRTVFPIRFLCELSFEGELPCHSGTKCWHTSHSISSCRRKPLLLPYSRLSQLLPKETLPDFLQRTLFSLCHDVSKTIGCFPPHLLIQRQQLLHLSSHCFLHFTVALINLTRITATAKFLFRRQPQTASKRMPVIRMKHHHNACTAISNCN